MNFIENKDNLEKLLNTKTLEEFINVRTWIPHKLSINNVDEFIINYADYCNKTTEFEDVQFCKYTTLLDNDDIVKIQYEDLIIWSHLIDLGYDEQLTTSCKIKHFLDLKKDYSQLPYNKTISEFLHRNIGVNWWQSEYNIYELTKDQKYTLLKNLSLCQDVFIGLLYNMYGNQQKENGVSIKTDLVNEFSNILYNYKEEFKHLVKDFVVKFQDEIALEDLYRISLICGANLCENIRPRKFVPILQNSWNDAKRLFDDISLQKYYKDHFDFSNVNSYEHFEFLKTNTRQFQRYFVLSLSNGDLFPYPELITETEATEMFNNNVELIEKYGDKYNINNFINQLLFDKTEDEWKTFRAITSPEPTDIV